MPDHSFLDQRYFVDTEVYNCPFCNRRHVAYSVYGSNSFDWAENKRCYVYFVRCHSCNNDSMHLSFSQVETFHIGLIRKSQRYRFGIDEGVDAGEYLDRIFFFSVPTSFFVLDERVPNVLRELLTEAEGCLKSNFLTGASACARKLVYELSEREKTKGDNYEERIKGLKDVHPEVPGEFFDTLLTIQQVTSTKVHEHSYDGWQSKHLRLILASLKEILHEIFVVPALRSDRRKAIVDLKAELVGGKDTSGESQHDEG